ncbi:unnamed protein product [Musa banksii]
MSRGKVDVVGKLPFSFLSLPSSLLYYQSGGVGNLLLRILRWSLLMYNPLSCMLGVPVGHKITVAVEDVVIAFTDEPFIVHDSEGLVNEKGGISYDSNYIFGM